MLVEISYKGFCALGALINPRLSRMQYYGIERYFYNESI